MNEDFHLEMDYEDRFLTDETIDDYFHGDEADAVDEEDEDDFDD